MWDLAGSSDSAEPLGLTEVIDLDNLSWKIDSLSLNEDNDVVTWKLEASGSFLASSMYGKMCDGWATIHLKEVWHSKIPTMIKNSMWHMIRRRLPSNDNIWKRHVPSNGECILCEEFEESNHIFVECTLTKFMRACVRELLGCD